ncbi:MAG: zinc dependent phospholipase C family protein [Erysipelotrichaceae bacterium]|nr:zinc dependent phospholipase C family protein [Erysipelotrichaceae bacterium]
MPAATTHVEFAKDVLRTFPALKKRIRNMRMFWLGSQGPDMLFFSHASALPGSLHKYGNLMHEKKVWPVIHFFESYAADDADLTSYVLGYLCHYALDSVMHPLIYAVTDEICTHEKTGQSDGVVHVTLESEIDVWMLHQRGRTIEDYDVYKYLRVNEKEAKKLAEMYHRMFHKVFHLDISASRIYHGIQEVYIWTKWIRPRKSTHDAIYKIENVIGSHFLTGMMLYDTKPGKIINLDHKAYMVPWSPHTMIHDSVPELYGKAVYKAGRLIRHHNKKDFSLDFKGEPDQN